MDEPLVREIVGVVGDVRSASLRTPPVAEAYVPHEQVPADSMGIVVRTSGNPTAVLPAVRQRLGAIDPDIPIVRPQPMIARSSTRQRDRCGSRRR